LLLGLLEPTVGCIRYSGQGISDVDLTQIRRQIGVVPEHIELFAGTIRSNIAMSNPDMDFEMIARAATIAQIHDEIIAMPLGYDTPLINRGKSLSAGQQQRISIARAVVADPKVLLLDEATSQLDATLERAIQNNLDRIHCTKIVIAHRLSTVVNANRIFVLEKGRLIEEGSHATLLKSNGMYASLFNCQIPG
jgi:ATP-binding cassette subfamily B protein